MVRNLLIISMIIVLLVVAFTFSQFHTTHSVNERMEIFVSAFGILFLVCGVVVVTATFLLLRERG